MSRLCDQSDMSKGVGLECRGWPLFQAMVATDGSAETLAACPRDWLATCFRIGGDGDAVQIPGFVVVSL